MGITQSGREQVTLGKSMQPAKISLYLLPGFDRQLLPVPAARHRAWWQDNGKTRNHAQHCLPLAMANSLGYFILAPCSFTVTWDGDPQHDACVEILERVTTAEVDAHAAYGSFTVQPGFVPMTEKPGDYLFIKSIPNNRGQPFHCMEALIEAWWSPARFGLVFLLNQPCTFTVDRGEPLAQMLIFRDESGHADLQVVDNPPEEYDAWTRRRYRPEYGKDFDYWRGRHPDGRPEPTHRVSWRQSEVNRGVDGAELGEGVSSSRDE